MGPVKDKDPDRPLKKKAGRRLPSSEDFEWPFGSRQVEKLDQNLEQLTVSRLGGLKPRFYFGFI